MLNVHSQDVRQIQTYFYVRPVNGQVYIDKNYLLDDEVHCVESYKL